MIYSKHIKSKNDSNKHIVFFHGGPGIASHNIYRNFWDKFNTDFHIHYLDYRNHGYSDDYENFSLDYVADDYYEYITSLNDKNIVIYLAGVSLGGWVILEFLSKYYEKLSSKIQKIVICNSEHRICKESILNNYSKGFSEEAFNTVKEMFSDNPNPDIGKRYMENCVCGEGKSYTPDDIAKFVLRFNYKLFYEFYKNKMYLGSVHKNKFSSKPNKSTS
ncbi:alpha/beta fold hydrolase [Francisella sp. 19X1-34]|uniref:alpha/beta fold hydrolase n=1 Tax=Francisella sp. 19X1-34 TaxID=3087177 RepID=UPI002E3707E8|nr:alpha/beta fold hydrolase [Francisella sp. 19X1-34]MED7788165.1 alpha/beta fold hydrolase [Francisella sp. 19X1-34]